jgi:histidyl-tRNA synthetase
MGRSVKAQMKFADKIKAKYTIILGCNEISANEATIKEMATGTQSTVQLDAESIAALIM